MPPRSQTSCQAGTILMSQTKPGKLIHNKIPTPKIKAYRHSMLKLKRNIQIVMLPKISQVNKVPMLTNKWMIALSIVNNLTVMLIISRQPGMCSFKGSRLLNNMIRQIKIQWLKILIINRMLKICLQLTLRLRKTNSNQMG